MATFTDEELHARLRAETDAAEVSALRFHTFTDVEERVKESVRRIRELPDISNVPLVAVTAKAMKGDRQKCLDAGASDYIAKPVDIDLLLALVRVWIGRSRSQKASVRPKRAAKVA